MLTLSRTGVASAIILAVSCFILANTLTRSQPINIVVGGEIITTIYTPVLYQKTEVAVIIVSSFAAGVSAFYLYKEAKEPMRLDKPVTEQPLLSEPRRDLRSLATVSTTLKVLSGPKRRIFDVINEKGGEVLQKDLYLETGYSKAKISRTLQELEARNVIEKRQYGNTKKIVLTEWMRKIQEKDSSNI